MAIKRAIGQWHNRALATETFRTAKVISIRALTSLRKALGERKVLATLLANVSWLVADRAIRLGVGLIVNIWIARHLGPTDFGLFNYAQAIAAIFSFASTLGLPEILVRDLVGTPARRRVILASAFILRVGGATIVLALCVAFIMWSRPDEPLTWLVMALLASAQIGQAADVIDADYQSRQSVRTIVLLRNINFLVFSASKIAAILFGAGVMTFAALYTLELFTIAILMYAAAKREGFEFRLADANLAEMRRLVGEVAPQILRLAAIGVYLRADQVLIGKILGDADLGIYTAATRLIEAWYLVVTAAMLAITPKLAQTFHFSPDKYDAELTMVIRVVTLASIAVALFLTAAAPTVILVLYGAEYGAASAVLVVHGWASIFSSLGQTVSGALVNKRLLHIGVYQAIVGAIVNIGTCLLLVPRWGVIGGAYAAVLTQFATGLLLNVAFRQTRPLLRIQLRALFFR